MIILEFISKQPAERQKLLREIHEIIILEDKNVKADIGSMMGKKMIVYKMPGIFKYALGSMKNYMSLHIMPIYGSAKLYAKYKELLPEANFQKGCINFNKADEMPLGIIRQMIHDCSSVDLLTIREKNLESKTTKC